MGDALYREVVAVFGGLAGKLTAVVVLTNTDDTGAAVEAGYGDLRFEPETP